MFIQAHQGVTVPHSQRHGRVEPRRVRQPQPRGGHFFQGWTCFFQARTFGVAGRNAARLAGPDDVGRSLPKPPPRFGSRERGPAANPFRSKCK